MRSRSTGRHIILILILAAAAALFFLIGPLHMFSIPAEANSAQTVYETYVVEEGDTLWSIADDHLCEAYPDCSSYMEELKRANNLSGAAIYTDELLLIPADAE